MRQFIDLNMQSGQRGEFLRPQRIYTPGRKIVPWREEGLKDGVAFSAKVVLPKITFVSPIPKLYLVKTLQMKILIIMKKRSKISLTVLNSNVAI